MSLELVPYEHVYILYIIETCKGIIWAVRFQMSLETLLLLLICKFLCILKLLK